MSTSRNNGSRGRAGHIALILYLIVILRSTFFFVKFVFSTAILFPVYEWPMKHALRQTAYQVRPKPKLIRLCSLS